IKHLRKTVAGSPSSDPPRTPRPTSPPPHILGRKDADLPTINGPIATPTAEPPIESQESVQWFTTTAGIGGVTREPLPAGQTVLATLSLTISPEPGTYHLTLTDAQFVDTIHVTHPATTGQPLEIVVSEQSVD
ncbi:MAG TPA: hypothetical protein P5316_09495, partial [Phycisphaerae bacterium]|nr:hypothetical protein [Phycisphaerae bacterium]